MEIFSFFTPDEFRATRRRTCVGACVLCVFLYLFTSLLEKKCGLADACVTRDG